VMPIRMNTKFVEIVVLKPGRRIFIAEATIASAKNRTKCPRFSRFHREAATSRYLRLDWPITDPLYLPRSGPPSPSCPIRRSRPKRRSYPK
jgi:hypothetical protein